MIGVVVLSLALAVVLWRLRRRRRQNVVAGLTSTAPTFAVSPPRRRFTTLKDEAL